jgi:hypothetical protein
VPRREPLPTEALRDLLGIVRSLYAAAVEQHMSQRKLDELHTIGVELVQILQLAEAPPGSMGQIAGWRRAESAVRRLGELVEEHFAHSLHPVVSAAVRRAIKAPRVALRSKDNSRQ